MQNAQVSNPNDHKVVSFHNPMEFGFTPEMGCMYDGRPINGINGSPGIDAGETIILPYHIAHRLAANLAKHVMNSSASKVQQLDANGQPIVAAIWDTEKLERMKNSYIKDVYMEEKPVAMSETDKLMAKVEEYKKMVDLLVSVKEEQKQVPVVLEQKGLVNKFSDKAEVLAELEKRGIKHDKRKNKAELEKLLA